MASKRTTPLDDFHDAPDPADTVPLHLQPVERLPSTAGGISALASAGAPHIYFDAAPFAGYFNGNGDITLVACRRIANLDGHGVVGDQVVTAVLHASIPALRALKEMIGKVEELAERELVNAVTAATGGAPPSGSVN